MESKVTPEMVERIERQIAQWKSWLWHPPGSGPHEFETGIAALEAILSEWKEQGKELGILAAAEGETKEVSRG